MYLFGLVLNTGDWDDIAYSAVAEDKDIAIEKCIASYEQWYGKKFPYKKSDFEVEFQVTFNDAVFFHRSYD